MSDQHSSPIKTPKQLVIVLILAFAVPITIIALLAQLVTGVKPPGKTEAETGVLERIKPVGEVSLAEPTGPKGNLTGEQIFQNVCKTCHEAGLAGAPKMGDNAAWAPRIKTGVDTLYTSAIKGKNAMPPKGGNADLSDEEVQRAVVFMANRSGANFKGPPEPAAASAATAPATPSTAAKQAAAVPQAPTAAAPQAPAAAAPNAAGGKPDGKKVFDSTCMACHATGVAGAPKLGDKAAWAPRLQTGMDALYSSALKGKGAMPAKGGNTALSDDEVKAGVDYMTTAAK